MGSKLIFGGLKRILGGSKLIFGGLKLIFLGYKTVFLGQPGPPFPYRVFFGEGGPPNPLPWPVMGFGVGFFGFLGGIFGVSLFVPHCVPTPQVLGGFFGGFTPNFDGRM